MDPTVGDVMTYAKDGGSYGLLVVAVVGVVRGWWVPRWQYDAIVKERDFLRDLVARTTFVGETVASKIASS